MLSDAIADAEIDMQRYLNNPTYDYQWLQPRINDLLKEMGRVRFMLDVYGLPKECVWAHVRPILPLLEQKPLDHGAINKLIDPILEADPPNEEQFKEWAKLL